MTDSRVADRVGRVLGGRYRLIAPIGVGTSGQVYLADDTRLRRQVAVKVLHGSLAEDELFLHRFRVEAQTAASLNQPNILAVHDWGEDDVPYLVSEYLGGGSLRSMLDGCDTLTASQALVVGLEAAKGLEYAHKRGVVQRDIKPANLLFDNEARLRIADFGLAKALAEASVTEPEGSMVGTVRYASPEQAQGRNVDARSDIYSLALVLIEAVTGELPFDADTPIATLMARVDQPIELDAEQFGALKGPLEHATDPDPRHRPDAGAFRAALVAAAGQLPRPEPLPLVGITGFDPAAGDHRDPTMLAPGVGDTVLPRRATGQKAAAAPRRRRWPFRVLTVFLLAAVGLGVWFALQESEIPTQVVPDAVGMDPAEFRSEVGDFFTLEEALIRQDNSEPGVILRTEPEAGAELTEGELITYYVSIGNEMKAVPTNLVGLSLEEAEQFLIGAGLGLGDVSERNDEVAPPGQVVEVAEVERELPGGATVDVVVSVGPRLRAVPEGLVGLAVEEVESQLAVERLTLGEVVEVYNNEVEAGLVLSVEPEAGTEVERDSSVTLTVSLGREPVVVPDVAGVDILSASSTLEGAGLCIGETDGPANTPVIATDPPSGTTVLFGACVRIITSEALAE